MNHLRQNIIGTLASSNGNSVNHLSDLFNSGESFDHRDCHGATPLHIACTKGNVPFVLELLNYISYDNVNALTNDGETPLMCALKQWRGKRREDAIECARILLSRGAAESINARTLSTGQTAMHHAQTQPYPKELISMLVLHGAQFSNAIITKSQGASRSQEKRVLLMLPHKKQDQNQNIP